MKGAVEKATAWKSPKAGLSPSVWESRKSGGISTFPTAPATTGKLSDFTPTRGIAELQQGRLSLLFIRTETEQPGDQLFNYRLRPVARQNETPPGFFAENLAFYEWKGGSASEVFDHKIVLERSGRARLDGPEMDFPSATRPSPPATFTTRRFCCRRPKAGLVVLGANLQTVFGVSTKQAMEEIDPAVSVLVLDEDFAAQDPVEAATKLLEAIRSRVPQAG